MGKQYMYEDQVQIEEALRALCQVLYEEVGICASSIKTFDNGDMKASFLIDKEGSAFHMEISNDGNRVVKEHLYIPDNSFIS